MQTVGSVKKRAASAIGGAVATAAIPASNGIWGSEICVAALQQIGYLIGHTPSRVSPNKLYKILKSELEAS